jgi:hypothetical protein
MQILKNTAQTCSEIQAVTAHSQPKESELQLLGTIPNFKTIHNIATTLIKYTSFKMNSRWKLKYAFTMYVYVNKHMYVYTGQHHNNTAISTGYDVSNQ